MSSFLLLSATPALAQGPPSWVADEILVGIRPGVDRSQAQAAYRAAGASLIKEIPQIGVHRLRVAPAALEAVERTLRARGEFAFVERNRRFPPIQVPNDPFYGSQWHLPKIGAAEAWDLVPMTPGAVIAILDSGVDPTHEDLVGKLVPGFNTYDDDTNTADVFGHGTKVAGAAGAKSNNWLGVASVAWESPIMPIRVTDTAGYGYSSTLSEGLVYAVDNGAAVMNMSFGGVAGSAAIRAAAQYAMEHGGLVVAAAGNCGCLDSTADTPYLLSVSATDHNDDLASFSSRGNYVDLAAPGVSIYTTRRGGGYGYSSGTSFSSPLVAGVAALLFSVDPDLTPFEVESILETTADDLGPAGYDTSFGYGRVNAYQALLAAGGSPPEPPEDLPPIAVIQSPSQGDTVSGTINVDVHATDDDGVTSVEFYLDGNHVATDASAPFGFSLDSAAETNGSHVLEAVAYDTVSNSGASPLVTVVFDNPEPELPDDSKPSVWINSPRDGDTFFKKARIRVMAEDDVGVDRIEAYVDGTLIGTKSCAATSCSALFSWSARLAANGAHEISALAYDASGNVGWAPPITVTKKKNGRH